MSLQSAMLRACYLRSLRRFVGPRLGWRVRNADNDLRAPSSPVEARKGAGSDPRLAPTISNVMCHNWTSKP